MRTLKEIDEMLSELTGDLTEHKKQLEANMRNDIDVLTAIQDRLDLCSMELYYIGDYEI